jgi:hypothetical protein
MHGFGWRAARSIGGAHMPTLQLMKQLRVHPAARRSERRTRL